MARGYHAATVLRIVGVNEATYYYRKKFHLREYAHNGGRKIPGYSLTLDNRRVNDEQVKEWLLELVSGEENVYGYRKLTRCLQRQHNLRINKKKVYRLCKELDILEPQRRIHLKHPRRIARNQEITGSNQLWEIDVKYGYIAGEDRFFYLMCIIDVYDRMIVDYHIGLSCEGKDAARIIKTALWRRQLFSKPDMPVIRTDNGPQFISHVFEDACDTLRTEHERIPPKTPNKNAHIESFHAVLERECLERNVLSSYQDAYQIINNYIEFYNNRRLHGKLYDLSPVEFIQQLALGHIKPFVVKV
nr:IS3 family transposase [Desulfotomaculum copahuensis]